MKAKQQLEALTNHLRAVNVKGLVIHQKTEYDKRKTTPKFFIQKGTHTISPALKYEDLNLFLLGMTRAKQFNS